MIEHTSNDSPNTNTKKKKIRTVIFVQLYRRLVIGRHITLYFSFHLCRDYNHWKQSWRKGGLRCVIFCNGGCMPCISAPFIQLQKPLYHTLCISNNTIISIFIKYGQLEWLTHRLPSSIVHPGWLTWRILRQSRYPRDICLAICARLREDIDWDHLQKRESEDDCNPWETMRSTMKSWTRDRFGFWW